MIFVSKLTAIIFPTKLSLISPTAIYFHFKRWTKSLHISQKLKREKNCDFEPMLSLSQFIFSKFLLLQILVKNCFLPRPTYLHYLALKKTPWELFPHPTLFKPEEIILRSSYNHQLEERRQPVTAKHWGTQGSSLPILPAFAAWQPPLFSPHWLADYSCNRNKAISTGKNTHKVKWYCFVGIRGKEA